MNQSSDWEETSWGLNKHEQQTQNLDRMRHIAEEIMKLSGESRQQTITIQLEHEQATDKLEKERSELAKQLSKAMERIKELEAKLGSITSEFKKLQTNWDSLFENVLKFDGGIDGGLERKRKLT